MVGLWDNIVQKESDFKLYSNNSTQTVTQRYSTKWCYSEKSLFCSTVAVKNNAMKFLIGMV